MKTSRDINFAKFPKFATNRLISPRIISILSQEIRSYRERPGCLSLFDFLFLHPPIIFLLESGILDTSRSDGPLRLFPSLPSPRLVSRLLRTPRGRSRFRLFFSSNSPLITRSRTRRKEIAPLWCIAISAEMSFRKQIQYYYMATLYCNGPRSWEILV